MTDSKPTHQFHLSLNVTDLERAIAFYRLALGIEPAKVRPDYAKFELTNPPLVLSLEPSPDAAQKLNHLGIRVPDALALRPFATRIQAGNLDAQYLQSVECCYSRQSKFTLTDPDGNLIELYVLEEELDHAPVKAAAASAASAAPQSGPQKAWEHTLGTDFPTAIPHADGELDEVRLRGTFNRRLGTAVVETILREAKRVLRPGGLLTLHSLVADREVEGKLPQLPGPAALVEHTPTETALGEALEKTGFGFLELRRFSHSPVFQFGGAQMREQLLTARRLAEAAAGDHVVVYKGPFHSITDDEGHTYRRGHRTAIGSRTLAGLNASGLADQFAILNEPAGGSACGTVDSRASEPEVTA
jgi:catechol 2,3-dioxygenase-like lactoylglutathione lyase family enzyme